MSSSYGKNLTVTIFGQSHSAAIGVTMDGFPAGFPVDMEALGRFLARRAAGRLRRPGRRPTRRSSSADL